MHTVQLNISDPTALRAALERATESRRIDAADAPAAGTLCKVVVTFGAAELTLFAHAVAGGYKLTDDPADIRFEVTRFLESVPAKPAVRIPVTGAEAAPVGTLDADLDEAVPGDEVEESVPDDEELAKLQGELGTANPLLIELKKIQKLSVTQKIKLAEEGDLTQRTLLYRMYGKLVFDGLLRNPRLTEMEVARLAKLGTLGQQQVQTIARKVEWLRNERIRNALLSNPRVPPPIIQKIVSMLGKHELRPLLQRRDFPPPVQQAIREANVRKSGA